MYERAISHKRADIAEFVLASEFQFHPLERDLPRFPWLAADHWDRETELSILFRLFDDRLGVDAIDFALDFSGVKLQPISDGLWGVTVPVLVAVLTGEDEGWRSETAAEVTVRYESSSPDRYVVSKVREVEIAPFRRTVEEDTWGGMWGRYHPSAALPASGAGVSN